MKSFKFIVLKPLTHKMIQEQLAKLRPKTCHEDWAKLKGVFDLLDLSQNPLLLHMIIDLLDNLLYSQSSAGSTEETASSITVFHLYEKFTTKWLSSQVSRSGLEPSSKSAMTRRLARAVWESPSASVNEWDLLEVALGHGRLGSLNWEEREGLHYELSTCSFMVRHGDDRYGFVHSSFADYFIAIMMAEGLLALKFDSIFDRPPNWGVNIFLWHFAEDRHVSRLLDMVELLERLITERLSTMPPEPSDDDMTLKCWQHARQSAIMGV